MSTDRSVKHCGQPTECRLCDAPSNIHNTLLPDHHDVGCEFERRAPVQGDVGWLTRKAGARPPGTVVWSEHLAAYERYALRFGRSQSAERIADRGGFGCGELEMFLGYFPKSWRSCEQG